MAKTHNHDLVGLVSRMDRVLLELHRSVSAASSELNPFDSKRALAALSHCRAYMNWVVGQPQLDLPESHGVLEYELPPEPDTPQVESDPVNDLTRLTKLARTELVNSQSSRKAAGLISFDLERVTAVVDKCEALLKLLEGSPSLDLPESSPRNPVDPAGPGKGGV